MINVSALYDTIILDGGHYEWRIANDETIDANTTIVKDALIEGKVNPVLFKQASIGNVISRELDFSFYKTAALDSTKPLRLQFRAVDDTQQSDWYDKGLFWIDTYDTSNYTDRAVIKAFDPLLKANVTYLETGVWTAKTDWAIVQEIATDIGVSIESGTQTMFSTTVTITEAPSIGVNGTTDIQMLSYIAIMRKGNWIINDNNELQLIPLFSELAVGADSVDIGDAVTDFDAADSETITGICLWANENTYYRYPDVTDSAWEALGGRKINANLYVMASDALAQEIYTAIGGQTYYPYSAPTAWVDPKYQLGDGITINNVSSVICNQTINLTALASCSLVAEAQEQVNSSYPQLTPQERHIAQQQQTIASIQVQADSIQSTVLQMTEADGVITQLQTEVTQNAQGIEAIGQRLDGQESYIRWDAENATVSVGASDAPSEAQFSPEGMKVVSNGATLLAAQGTTVVTKHLSATDSLTIGTFEWVNEGNGGLSLIYGG